MTTLVFLHGWGGSGKSWAPIVERLKSKYKIFAPDLPGFGLNPLSRQYSLTDYVTDLVDYFQKNKIVKPILIGHSFGGQVAAKFAIEHSEKISKLVLVDAAVARDNSLIMRTNIKFAKIGKKIFGKKWRNLYYKIRGWEDSDYLKAKDQSFLAETAGQIFREDLTDSLDKIKTPTLIFWGEKDEATPMSVAKLVNQKIINSKLVVIPNAGHFSYLDNQEKFCEEILKL